MRMNQELQPVILAAGSGSRMYPLTEEIPKALLPVGNFPMIWYPISYLKRLGFEEIIVVVLKSAIHQFTFLKGLSDQSIRIDLVPISDDDELQTADSLKELKDKIKCDLLVMSCDSILDAPFHRLADLHRARNASLTALLANQVDLSSEKDSASAGKKGGKTQVSVQRDLVAVDNMEKRLLYLSNEADLDHDAVIIKKSLLKRYPQIIVQNNLVDMHLYILKQWVLNYIAENRSLTSLKGDVVPHLVSKQFSKHSNRDANLDSQMVEGDPKPDIFSFAEDKDEYSQLTRDWSFCPNQNTEKGSQDSVRCHAHVSVEDFCLRVNTIPAYMYINRMITKLLPNLLPAHEVQLVHPSVNKGDKCQVGSDCMVGESSTIGENVSVKRSIIGKHCTIKNKVKVSNSVIMDHVVIEEDCDIRGSIICNNAYIKARSSLKDCQVGNEVTIQQQADKKNEFIVKEVMDFDY